jgi:pimeloyl-ACP methyl ester carboxylesterase
MSLSIKEIRAMSTITTKDGTEIYYEAWGDGSVVTFSHGWPLNVGARDGQILFLAQHGYRVIAHDRRGVQEDTEPAETGLSCELPDEDPGADLDRPGARPGRIQ